MRRRFPAAAAASPPSAAAATTGAPTAAAVAASALDMPWRCSPNSPRQPPTTTKPPTAVARARPHRPRSFCVARARGLRAPPSIAYDGQSSAAHRRVLIAPRERRERRWRRQRRQRPPRASAAAPTRLLLLSEEGDDASR